MGIRNLFIVLTVICITISQISGEKCQPEPVQNVVLQENSILTWSLHINESCTIAYYVVQIHNGITVDYTKTVNSTELSLDFLPVCQSFRFLITAISTDDIAGIERVYFTRLPLPAGANLTVALVMVSQHDDVVYLRWVMDDEWEECAERFRVVIYDEDDDTVIDEYTRESFINITRLVPCTRYTFGVVALYALAVDGPITTVERIIEEAPISPPTLKSIQLERTSVGLTWVLEDYRTNRCAVTSLEVIAPSLNVSQAILDDPSRQPVTVNLSNLQSNIIYVLNVTVINAGGRSAPVIVAVQTLS